jgi:N6-adenosine-specific RNA methylase IME4
MKYGAILIDPPWDFQVWSDKGKGRSPAYATMSFENLFSLDVADRAAPDCALFLWAVDSHLQTALTLIDAWGFIYKTIAFVWVKPSIGLGYWSRKEAEVCLMATRGKPKRVNADVRQVIQAPRRQHSRKPDEIYTRIERLVGGAYLEMFARQRWPGWDQWGDQTDKFEATSEG